MSARDAQLSSLTDGSLDQEQARLLIDGMDSDPDFRAEAIDDMRVNDLMFRELDATRSDEAFLHSFESLLEQEIEGDGDADPDDDGDFDGDGGNLDLSGADPGPILPDPVSATATSAGGGIAMGPVVAVVMAAVVAGTAIVYQSNKPPALPAAVDAATPPAFVEVIPERDLYIVASTIIGELEGAETAEVLELIQGRKWASTHEIYMRFDLSGISGDIDTAYLRLHCVDAPEIEHAQPVAVHLIGDDWSKSKKRHDGRLHTGESPKVTVWAPREGQFSEVDLSEAVKTELVKDGKLSLWIRADVSRVSLVESGNVPPPTRFASAEHPNADWRPVLLVQLKK